MDLKFNCEEFQMKLPPAKIKILAEQFNVTGQTVRNALSHLNGDTELKRKIRAEAVSMGAMWIVDCSRCEYRLAVERIQEAVSQR